MAAARTTTESKSHRLGGIDIARAIALVGMLAVHFGPQTQPGWAGTLYALPHGRASLLFAVVAGVGIALLSARIDRQWEARQRLVWFGIVLLPLGLYLQTLDHFVAVILHAYAAYYLFGMLVLGLSRQWLLRLAIAATLVGPALYLFGRGIAEEAFNRQTFDILDSPSQILAGLLYSGPYPLLTWAAPLLWGMWLGRLDLRDSALQLKLVLIGLGVALLVSTIEPLALTVLGEPLDRGNWRYLLIDDPHSQMPLWIVNGVAASFAVTGASLYLGARFARAMRPLVVTGQLALTIYVAHVVALHFADHIITEDTVGSAMVWLSLFVGAAAIFALVWRQVLPRGPLETMLHAPWAALVEQLKPQPAIDRRHEPVPDPTSSRTAD
jgi:uncharacterized membrane protein